MKNIILLITLTISMFAAVPHENAGTSGAQFLKFGKSARFVGFGEITSAVWGDVDQVYYNPAGIVLPNTMAFSLMYTRYISELNFLTLAGVRDFGKIGYFGAGLSFMVNTIEFNSFDRSTGVITQTGQEIRTGSFILSLAYAKVLRDHLSLGGTMKIMNDKLDTGLNDFNFAIDVGGILDMAMFDKRLKRFTYGITVLNLGTPSQFGATTLTFRLPITFRSGVAYDWQIKDNHQLLSGLEFEKVRDRGLKFNIATEYTLYKMAKFRFGYKIGDGKNGIKWGLGYHYKRYRIDYSFDYGDLGINNRIEMAYTHPLQAKAEVDLDALYYLAVKKFSMDDLEGSKKILLVILRIDPGYKNAKERLDEINDITKKRKSLENFRRTYQELE